MKINVLSLASWVSSLLLLSVYFSTAFDSILAILLLILWISTGMVFKVKNSLKNNPVAFTSVLLFAFMAIGMIYSSVDFNVAFLSLLKYDKLIILVILCMFLVEERSRELMIQAFVLGSIITIIGSYIFRLGEIHFFHSDFYFRDRIDHSLFVAFFGFYCFHNVIDSKKNKYLYVIMIVVCIHNLFFICDGRTGQLVFVALCLLFSMQRLTLKQTVTVAIVVFVFLSLFINFSKKASRIIEGVENTQGYLKSSSESTETSMGLRYSFWKNSIKIITKSPLLGHGTGSFLNEYKEIAVSNEALVGGTPHNEFLMITAQLGIVGLMFFLLFLFSQYFYSLNLTSKYKYFAQGVLLTEIIASFFNPSFISHVKGYWLVCLIAIPFSSLNVKNIKNA